LIHRTGGAVTFDGEEIAGLRPNEITLRGISLVTEHSNLFLGMSVSDNLLLGACAAPNKKEMRDKLDFVFELFPDLPDRRGQLAGTLSGGQRKMLGIARSVMSRARLLLVDEPSLGLAPNLAFNVFAALQNLNQNGLTILLVEQNVETALRLSGRGYVMEQGSIVLQGTSSELSHNPHIQKSYLGL